MLDNDSNELDTNRSGFLVSSFEDLVGIHFKETLSCGCEIEYVSNGLTEQVSCNSSLRAVQS